MAELRFLDERVPAWGHKAMHQFEAPLSAMDAVQAADLDYAFEKAPIYAQVPSTGQLVEVKGRYEIIDPRHGNALGEVGPDYRFMQNRELAQALDAHITKQYGVVALGETLNGDGIVFVLDAGETSILGDGIHQYYLVVETRTGKETMKSAFTALRFWCTNTLMTALSQANMLMATRHNRQFTINVAGQLEWVSGAERLKAHTIQLFEAMAKRQLQPAEFNILMDTIYPYPADARVKQLQALTTSTPSPYVDSMFVRAEEAYQKERDKADEYRRTAAMLFQHWRGEPAQHGTLWAAYNVVAEIEDHMAVKINQADSVHQSALLGDRMQVKVRALKAAEELVKA